MNLAPIGVSTYIRLEHLKQTISALQDNFLAKESELYVFSDAARPGDEEKVIEVRNYLHNISGFKEVHVVERGKNDRIFNNRDGMRQLLDKYGRMIFMEEDIVTAPGYLQFMNDALDFYSNDSSILSISGYSVPIRMPMDYQYDSYTLPRFNGWGFGIWKNRFLQVDYIDETEFKKTIKSFSKLSSGAGSDLPGILMREVDGKIDAWDVKAIHHQFVHDMKTVCPVNSLVRNIGHDGSGLHSGVTDKYKHKKLFSKTSEFIFNKESKPDIRIVRANYLFRSSTMKEKIRSLLIKTNTYYFFRKLRNKYS